MRLASIGWLALLGLGGCFTQALDAAGDSESSTGEPVSGTTSPVDTADPQAPTASGTTTHDDPDHDTGQVDTLDEATTGPILDVGMGTERGGPCCEPHPTPGCSDLPGVQECVCEVDAYCCEVAWDLVCIDLMKDAGCGECGEPPPPVDLGSCCEPNEGALGCLDTTIADCVCGYDPFCCEYSWDDQCVATAIDYGCGCDGSGTDGVQDCCTAAPAPGCADVVIESCVCDFDPFCCDTAWDNACVTEVVSGGCGSCVYPLGMGDCCTENGSAGCNDQDIQDCVCALDPFCCASTWDDICVGDVEDGMCGECPDVPGTGSGSSDGGSDTAGTEPATSSTTM